jgi:hypothetical protein
MLKDLPAHPHDHRAVPLEEHAKGGFVLLTHETPEQRSIRRLVFGRTGEPAP